MASDTWKHIPREEWQRRLRAARAEACRRLAKHGVDDCSAEDSIAGLILEHPTGRLLHPGLAVSQRAVAECVKQLGDPELSVTQNKSQNTFLSEHIFDYAMSAVEAAYLFGVITGAHVPWSVVEHLGAPTTPPAPKKARAGKKGGAR